MLGECGVTQCETKNEPTESVRHPNPINDLLLSRMRGNITMGGLVDVEGDGVSEREP